MGGQSSQSSPRKRKQPEYIDLTGEDEVEDQPKKSRKKDPHEEKRLRVFRAKAPRAFRENYQRATTQRFYVLGRTRGGDDWCPEEVVELTGSTGNIYHVHVARQPTCDCPHGLKGNQCKHILYVLSRVLHARFDLVYQLALLSSELWEIFQGAPPIEVGDEAEGAGAAADRNRKSVEGDCPICFSEFEAGDKTVYCKATCGNNIHTECFEMWAATKRQSPGAKDQVTCPMCRSLWQGDDDVVKKIMNTGVVGREGYVNVADQLGISRVRDTSTYYDGPRRGVSYGGWGGWY
ncbi:E3 ubiquitin-protein ligase Zswim2 [Apiospora marii]|uniref:E3 ubiquitin-protein ligase Zswim2 n=1 Tax=Apiospora marii TaxID=335849 RepID=A0ABR1RZD9_9PEZI